MRRRDIRAMRKDKRAPWALQPKDNNNERQQLVDAAFEQLERERAQRLIPQLERASRP